MKKFLSTLFLAMVLSVSALAQYDYPVGPNTGSATTPFANNTFSITFNGPVTVTNASRNETSTDVTYYSSNSTAAQAVVVRSVDHAIAVDYTSSDFYVSDLRGCDSKTYLSQGDWGGHPYSYVFCTYASGGQTYTLRVRFIIVNATTVLFVKQLSLEATNDRDQWLDFEYSLRIR